MTDAALTPRVIDIVEGRSPGAIAFKRLKRNKAAMVSAVVLILIAAFCFGRFLVHGPPGGQRASNVFLDAIASRTGPRNDLTFATMEAKSIESSARPVLRTNAFHCTCLSGMAPNDS